MTKWRPKSTTLSQILKILIITSALSVITQAEVPEELLFSSYPAVDMAARAFAVGQLDVATQRFETIYQNTSAPSIARSLALFGLVEIALAREDITEATAAWKRLVADASLPRFHRDTAQRRIKEMGRMHKGLPTRDPAAYRVQLPILPRPGKVFYVALNGSDIMDGSQKKPFRTLERARDAVRFLKQSRAGVLPKGGVKIIISGGEYPWERTLRLTSEDSGSSSTPIVYEVEPGQSAVFSGGVRITTWRPISEARVRDKLDVRIRDSVLEADLKALRIEDFGDATSLRHCPELFVDGKAQRLARWPNEGFVNTGAIRGNDTFKAWNRIEGCRDGKFIYVEDRPSQWLDEPDVRLYGYWFWDWFEEFQKVASIDPESHMFTLSKPYSRYGYRKGQRY